MAKKKGAKRPDIYDTLGYDKARCPTCKVRLYHRICLNACHLNAASKARFARMMTEANRPPTKGGRP